MVGVTCLADTDLDVFPLCLGGNVFGWTIDEERSFAVLDTYFQAGGNFIDTADSYGRRGAGGAGESERIIGRWIASRGNREQLVIATKIGMSPDLSGLSPATIRRGIEGSLERLGVERVDLYLAHDFDPTVPLGDTLGAFDELVAGGKIRAYGVSNFDAGQLEAALEAGSPQAIQNAHSLLDRDDEERVLPLCARREIAYLAFGPLAGGWLTGKYRRDEAFPAGSRMTQRPEPYERLISPGTFTVLERLESAAAERGMSLAGLALAWLLADERVGQIVVGPGRPEHLEPVREALAAPLSRAERNELVLS